MRARAALPATPSATKSPSTGSSSPFSSRSAETFSSPSTAASFSVHISTPSGKSAVSGSPLVHRMTFPASGSRACTSCKAYSPLPSTAAVLPR